MENLENELVLTDLAKNYLKESAKWSKFLSIIGFIGVGFMVLIGLFFGKIISSLPTATFLSASAFPIGIFSVVYIGMAALYFFPIYYLYKYATDTKAAIDLNDSDLLEKGLEKLKSHHKFLGIMMLVILSIYVFIFFIAFIGGIFAIFSR